MCGITGVIHKNNEPVDLLVLQSMTRRLAHRGPDEEGYFVEKQAGLGHRRLSIIDLSSGQQPMYTEDGRYVIVFNGEIYNFLEIRQRLEKEGIVFKTRSDTEVLLKFYVQCGETCVAELNGMFAFAIWDKKEKQLFAARDRMGKKPFYYWSTQKHFAFASECKAFLAHPDFSRKLDSEALSHFFQYEYVPAPFSIFHGVKKLAAGHYLVLDQKGVTIRRYWDIPLNPLASSEFDEGEVKTKLINLLDRAVDSRLVSDVPLGVFLSGGIDSSTIVALMARHRPGKDIKTFSINFDEPSFDESAYSSLVAKKFSTDHHQQTLTPHKMIDILPEVASFLDEPFADYSIIPTYLLSQFTRQSVTVALGGDGSDELFCGYPTFFAGSLADYYYHTPRFAKKIIHYFSSFFPASDQDMSFEFKLKQFLYGAGFPPVLRNQVWLGALHRLEQQKLFSSSFEAQTFLRDGDPLELVSQVMESCPSKNPGDRMLYFYQKFYLEGDILVKTDRASMAASLEVRAPFLDKDLVEYVSTLPYEFKAKGHETKYLLKKALEPVLPHEIIYRKKKGFGIPIAVWLKNELRPTLQETLHHDKLKKDGIFNPVVVDRLIAEHLAGKKNNRKPLFALLMFQWWKEKYL